VTARNIRLAVVSDAVQPFNDGGKEARYAAILPRLVDRGIDVDVHTMKWWPQPGSSLQVGQLTMRALSPLVPLYSGSRRSIRQAAVFGVCSLRMLGRQYDVLEADAIPFVQLYPLWAVSRLRRRPFLVTWHEVWGRDYWRSYLGRAGILAAWLEQMAARLPDVIIATSDETADRVRALRGGGRPHDVVVVPPGVDQDEIAAVVPASGVGELLCVGRLLPNKNVDLVIRALAGLRDSGRDVSLTVVGQGPERDGLHKLAAELGVADSVDFRDPIPDRKDLLSVMAGAQVVAFPSVREGFGMVALEALSCGVPVVTSDHPDNYARNLVRDGVTGRVCPATMPHLTQALADVLDNREAMASQAAASVADYDWRRLSESVAQVVGRLGRARAGGPGSIEGLRGGGG
jgi:glycosyltransferase involved in cell wall biosynthesis